MPGDKADISIWALQKCRGELTAAQELYKIQSDNDAKRIRIPNKPYEPY